ncbi:hypothetical protein ACFLUK_03340 [Chloroflexota bacterium]
MVSDGTAYRSGQRQMDELPLMRASMYSITLLKRRQAYTTNFLEEAETVITGVKT